MLGIAPLGSSIGLRALDVGTIGQTVATSRTAVALGARPIGAVFCKGTIGAVGARWFNVHRSDL